MKTTAKSLLALAFLALVGCGGTHSASINFPFVRVFNAADGETTIQMQFHDLASNLLSTSQTITLGTVNIPSQDANFVYTQGTVTMLDQNSTEGQIQMRRKKLSGIAGRNFLSARKKR